MKRICTLILVLTALTTMPFTASAEEVVFDFANNPMNWPTSEDTWSDETGNVTTLTADGVVLTSVQGNSFYANILLSDETHGTVFMVRRNAGFKLTAPEGKAIVGAAMTMWNETAFDFVASTGTVADNGWTGNATEVGFDQAGGIRYFEKMVITLADENSETVKPGPVEADEVADIAAFNALPDGTTAKLLLNDAVVNGELFGSYYVEDASGATVVKGIALTVGTALNGYIVGTKATDTGIDYMGYEPAPFEPQLQATDASTFEATATSLTGTVVAVGEAGQQAYYGRLVTVEDVTISGGGQNKTLADADGNTIKARDYMGVLPAGYTWPESAASVTGVVVYYMTGWFLMPISAEAMVATGISATAMPTADAAVYSLQGIRLNGLQKGINIVNGKKMVVK